MNGVGAITVWNAAVALPGVLLGAWILSSIARWMLRGRAKLRTDTSIVITMLSTSVGLFLAGAIDPGARLNSWVSIGFSLGITIAGIAGYGAISAHFQKPIRADLTSLLTQGESARVEYKSTARVNLLTGAKDPKMEQVIAKTVNGFVNGDGGTLLIGVDDAGTPLGLAADFATLKSPDADRFELWLRDMLTSRMGQNAAARVDVDFETVADIEGHEALVCRLDCHSSPNPVYLHGREGAPELWLRTGNSTRRLGVDEATEYVMHRWPLGPGSAVAAQLRAAVRFSGAD